MNPVVSQGICQSCWAMAATASIEGVYSIRFGIKHKLSNQQMIDCTYADKGCVSGSPDDALRYIMKAGGQMRSSDYPYVGVKRDCKFDASKVAVEVIYRHFISNHKYALTYGPIPAVIQANSFFDNY